MTNQTNETPLLPCPFCHGDALAQLEANYRRNSYGPRWTVNCIICGGQGRCADSREDAIKAWNTRAPIIAEPPLHTYPVHSVICTNEDGILFTQEILGSEIHQYKNGDIRFVTQPVIAKTPNNGLNSEEVDKQSEMTPGNYVFTMTCSIDKLRDAYLSKCKDLEIKIHINNWLQRRRASVIDFNTKLKEENWRLQTIIEGQRAALEFYASKATWTPKIYEDNVVISPIYFDEGNTAIEALAPTPKGEVKS